MEPLSFLLIAGAGAAWLVGRAALRKRQQSSAANAAGLTPAYDLRHVTPALQQTALWTLTDGGFEQRVVHGVLSRDAGDIDVTAFDLETLRERRGEWAYLPVEPPFRVGAVVSVVACEADRVFPHLLLKRAGGGDLLASDTIVDRASSVAKTVRATFGVVSSVPAELPAGLPTKALEAGLPPQWRAYGDATLLAELLAGGLGAVLDQAGRRDLVVELLDSLILIYPAARDVVGADAFGDLTAMSLAIVDGVLAASRPLSPRGVEPSATPQRRGSPAS